MVDFLYTVRLVQAYLPLSLSNSCYMEAWLTWIFCSWHTCKIFPNILWYLIDNPTGRKLLLMNDNSILSIEIFLFHTPPPCPHPSPPKLPWQFYFNRRMVRVEKGEEECWLAEKKPANYFFFCFLFWWFSYKLKAWHKSSLCCTPASFLHLHLHTA